MTFSYAVTNRLTGLTASAFSVSTGSGPSGATELYLNDGRMDRQYALTGGTTIEAIDIDLGSAQSVSAVAVLNHNLVALGAPTITVTAADNAGFSVGVVTPKAATTLNTAEPKHKDHVLQFGAVSKRYWRITFTHSTAAALRIGELFLASSNTQLSRYMIDGSGESESFYSVTNKLLYGETRTTFLAGPLRSKTMRFQDWNDTQLNQLRTMWAATKGMATPLLFISSYEATGTAAAIAEQECIFGRVMVDDFRWTYTDALYRQPPEIVIASLGREAGA